MKLEILKEHLDSAVGIVGKVSNKNLSLPVLGCVVIAAHGDSVVVRATNLDVSVEVSLKAKILEDGVVAVPAGILTQAVSTATDQKLTLTTSGSAFTITGSHGTASLKTVDVADFPTLPYVKDGQGTSVSLPSEVLVRVLRAVVFAASPSGMRPELSSVFVSVTGAELVAAATDSFRLAEMRVPLKAKEADPILIPARNIPDILRVVQMGDTVEVRIGENQATFIAGGNYVTTRTVDSAFPEYRAIIPKSFGSTATALTEDALRAFRKVSVFTDAYNQVELALAPSKKTFAVSAMNAAVGETHEELDAALQGDDITINFNARYIVDALGAVSGDSVVFKIAGPGKPMVIEEAPARGLTYLVMPMNK
jgi:DNA polymerase-3 subunit beta